MRKKRIFYFAAIALCTLIVHPAVYVQAQGSAAANSKEPLEITADGTLEWHRNDNIFVAISNATARQGDVSVSAAKLTADYRDGSGQVFQIWRVRADTNVHIQSNDTSAYGDNAIYDINEGYAEITGSDLRLISPDQTVKARDKFEYWAVEGKLVAIGNARIIRQNEQGEINTLDADVITAYLKDNAQGQRVLERMEADGNVVITTPTETLSGDAGTYNAETQIAEITGNVKIQRGPNILEGGRAEVNLETSISRMFGNGGTRGQVRGVFYPGSTD